MNVSYLPLSHIAAQVVDIHGMMSIGGHVFFAQPDALKVLWMLFFFREESQTVVTRVPLQLP